ncbi:MAG: hypothetical protein ACRDBG_23535 [Waterburya sp.]
MVNLNTTLLVNIPTSDDVTYMFSDLKTLKQSLQISYSNFEEKPEVIYKSSGYWEIVLDDEVIGTVKLILQMPIYSVPTHF